MRVIAGSVKGARLQSPPGGALRPTSDRTKQILFDTLFSYASLQNSSILDLFAGSGSLGIEALSRGARNAVFVDSSRKALQFLRKNLEKTHFTKQSRIFNADAVAFLMKKRDNHGFDFVFADPPYEQGFAQKVVTEAGCTELLRLGGLLVLEESFRTSFELPESLALINEKKCGDTRLFFISREA